jgi:hypothetical protein
MIVLTPTPEQYQALNLYTNGLSILEFVKDGADKWIVGLNILTDPAFEAIYDQLILLQEIEFTPIPNDIP